MQAPFHGLHVFTWCVLPFTERGVELDKEESLTGSYLNIFSQPPITFDSPSQGHCGDVRRKRAPLMSPKKVPLLAHEGVTPLYVLNCEHRVRKLSYQMHRQYSVVRDQQTGMIRRSGVHSESEEMSFSTQSDGRRRRLVYDMLRS